MPVTTIYFIRHAHNDYIKDEQRPLSKKGLAAANGLTALFETVKIDLAYSSDYKRAVQTIEPICKQQNLQIELLSAFRERIVSENPLEDFQQALYKLWHNPQFSFEGGESNETAQKRGVDAFEKLINKENGKTILIGGHGNLITLILQHYDAQFDYHYWKNMKMPAVIRMQIENKKCTIQTIYNKSI